MRRTMLLTALVSLALLDSHSARAAQSNPGSSRPANPFASSPIPRRSYRSSAATSRSS